MWSRTRGIRLRFDARRSKFWEWNAMGEKLDWNDGTGRFWIRGSILVVRN